MKYYSRLDLLPSGKAEGGITPGCLILEGGAFRGVYTSGVLDCLMENGINFQTVVGVSAGALNGYNYVARQIGRSARVNLIFRHDQRWVGAKALRTNHGLVGFDFVFNDFNTILPSDQETFMDPERRFIAVATNCLTGKPEFFEKDCGFINDAVAASASMPMASRVVMLDGKPYLDGGCSCKIPIEWALEQGFEKILVVRTRHKQFRKREESGALKLERRLYHRFPNLVKALEDESLCYNRSCGILDELEKQGKIMVIAPDKSKNVHRLEGDMEKLGDLYWSGYHDAVVMLDEIKEMFCK